MGALGLSSLSFLAPLALLGLLALPALWWLLRATPPQPTHALFPPMQLLARLTSAEETPVRTPWWLLLLRLLLAAILILAFAGPQWRANAPLDLPGTSDAPLLLVMETDWATAHDWEERLDRARRIVRTADDQGRAVGLLAMPQPFDTVPLPSDGAAVLAALDELRPQPASQDLSDALAQVTRTLDTEAWRNAAVVWMTSGLSKQADGMEALAALADRVDAALVHGKPPDRALSLDITPSGPTATLHTVAFDEGAITLPPRRELEGARVVALDISGRQLAAVPLTEANAADGSVLGFDLPVDVRNDIARIALQPTRHAGHVLLIDDRLDRRQVAIVGTQGSDDAQPLLSSTTYIERAIEPFADTVAPRTGDSNTEIARAIAGGADVLVLSGAVTLTPSTTADLQDWVARGGVLIRFASTSLADSDDPLLPVPLRAVDRQLGG
ncbi:MAG: BatA domain-containing protein, partial [Devosiaceae bacterium]|nr:BatA domain-containing protein [Devosiaceae bacterium MH13]